MADEEFILTEEGCIDLLNQLKMSYGNKTIEEILFLIQTNKIKCDLAISRASLLKIDDVLKSIS